MLEYEEKGDKLRSAYELVYSSPIAGAVINATDKNDIED